MRAFCSMNSRRGSTSSPIRRGEDVVRLDASSTLHLQQRAARGIHRGLGELIGIHLAEALVALDREALLALARAGARAGAVAIGDLRGSASSAPTRNGRGAELRASGPRARAGARSPTSAGSRVSSAVRQHHAGAARLADQAVAGVLGVGLDGRQRASRRSSGSGREALVDARARRARVSASASRRSASLGAPPRRRRRRRDRRGGAARACASTRLYSLAGREQPAHVLARERRRAAAHSTCGARERQVEQVRSRAPASSLM